MEREEMLVLRDLFAVYTFNMKVHLGAQVSACK
jgi:hypothetical protein